MSPSHVRAVDRKAGGAPRWGALPDVASSFINIGAVYAGKGDLENVLCQFQKALEIQTRVFGSDHPDVADSKENIGLVFQKMTKKSEARQMFTEAASGPSVYHGRQRHQQGGCAPHDSAGETADRP